MTINGANFTVTADTLCNDGSVEKYFTGGAPSGWSLGALGSGSGPTSTANLFSDSFESQDLSASSASVNTINFQWTDANRTSVLTQVDTSTARRVYPTAFIQDYTDGRDVTAKTGSYSLGIEYAGGVEMAEQRFSFDAQDDVWIRYWMRVPENFSHGTMNNKFFSIWQDSYDSAGTVTWETRPENGNDCYIYYKDGGASDPDTSPVSFITTADAGRWMQIVIHVARESADGANDGVIELYRRWEGESSFTQMHSISNADAQYSDGSGYRAGYVMGYANDAYDADTWWLVDDFEVSDESLLYQQVAGPTSVPDLFSDSFESQDLSASAASVNNANFQWTSGNRTSVLTQVDASTARRVYPTAFIQDYTDGRDVTAKTGSYSLGIEYAAGVEMAEQRFAFDPQQELWIRYWIRVPENFVHESPTTNSKFLALWSDGYSNTGDGSTIWFNFWPDGNGGSDAAFTYSDGGYVVGGPHNDYTPFISTSDRGRWMQIVAHVNLGTNGANDGVIELFRRWEDESDFTTIHSVNNVNLRTPSSPNGLAEGYLMGWINNAYAEDTWWLIDDFELSTGSLL